jgi:hypothetical protein
VKNYSSLLADLGFSQQVIDSQDGKVFVPRFSLMAPFDPRYGFPPIIIPLWSNEYWPGYIGVITSWFGGTETGFAKYYSSSQYLAEVALTFDQLKAWLCFDFLCNIPDYEEVGIFAQSIGLCQKNEVEEYFINCTDYPDLKNLPVFMDKLPQFLVGGSCNSQPSWVLPSTNKNEIISLIERKEYLRAWHGINSPGLTREDIVELLEAIAPFSTDVKFGDLVECWIQSSGNLILQ